MDPKTREKVQAEQDSIVSSDASTLHKYTIPISLFYSPTQQCTLDATSSMDVGGEYGPSKTTTPHDDREDGGIECDSFYPSTIHVVRKGSFPISSLVNDGSIPIKIQKIACII